MDARAGGRCRRRERAHRLQYLSRYEEEGEDGLLDRSSAPQAIPHRTPDERVELVACLRRLRMTAAEIAEVLQMPLSTVQAILTRIGLGRLARLEPPEPANRYEKQRPGELIHVDVKKLGRIGRPGHRVNGDRRSRSRGIGWEYVHIAVDDASRLAYVAALAQLDRSGLQVRLGATDLEPLVARLERVGNRIVAALVASAFIEGRAERRPETEDAGATANAH